MYDNVDLQNYFNFTNHNFYDVDVADLHVDLFFNQQIMASATNETRLTLPIQSTRLHYISMNVTFEDEQYYVM